VGRGKKEKGGAGAVFFLISVREVRAKEKEQRPKWDPLAAFRKKGNQTSLISSTPARRKEK